MSILFIKHFQDVAEILLHSRNFDEILTVLPGFAIRRILPEFHEIVICEIPDASGRIGNWYRSLHAASRAINCARPLLLVSNGRSP